MKSNRATLIWALPFCAALVLFAPDLVEYVLGDEWEPAVLLIQGLAVAAALQQLGFDWFSLLPRAQRALVPTAVEAAARGRVPACSRCRAWRSPACAGFVAGRMAAVAITLAVRARYIKRLLPGVEMGRLLARAAACRSRPAPAAALVPRLLTWGERSAAQAALELALFVAVCAALTLRREGDLIRELARSARVRGGEPVGGPAQQPG